MNRAKLYATLRFEIELGQNEYTFHCEFFIVIFVFIL